MKFSADDFKQLYAEMPDEELRSLDRGELTELARQCYDDEMKRRGLAAKTKRRTVPPVLVAEEPEEIAPAEDASEETVEQAEEEDLAPAAIFPTREEASAARARLQSAEIPAFLEDDTLAGGGFRVLVAASDARNARELLEAGHENEQSKPK